MTAVGIPIEKTQHMTTFPAISVTLEEIRRLYDMEEGRRASLENKAGILIGVIGVLLTIVSLFEQKNSLLIPFYLLLIIALLFGFLVFRLTKYKIPHKKYEDFYQYASMDENEALDKFLLNYIKAAQDMEKKNNQKVIFLQLSFILTVIAWIYLLAWVIYYSR